MMKRRSWAIVAVGIVVVAGIVIVILHQHLEHNRPRRNAGMALKNLDQNLRTGADAELLSTVAIPSALQGRTVPEQAEFLRKALKDEVSPEGIKALVKEGSYGPLAQIFPNQASVWASQAGVRESDCVAFRLERRGIVAEVVLATNPVSKVVRCNNVEQMGRRNP